MHGTSTPSRKLSCLWAAYRITSGWTLSCAHRKTCRRRCTWPAPSSSAPRPWRHYDHPSSRTRRASSVSSRHRPLVRRCHHQQGHQQGASHRPQPLPLRHRRYDSSAVSRRRNNWSADVRACATTATSLSFAATSASGCFTSSRPTTQTTTTHPRTMGRPRTTWGPSWTRLLMHWWSPYML
jgi:hypothetical protein